MQSEEVGEHWTLGAEDLAWLSGMPDAGKLGLAVQLMCWRRNGRFPDDEADPAPAVVRNLAAQIGVGVEVLEDYEWTGRTGRRHRRLVLDRLAVTSFDERAEARLRTWLSDELLREPTPSTLDGEVNAWFACERVGRPGGYRLDRILRSARAAHDDAALQRVANRLDAGMRERLDALLADDDGETGFARLAADPGRVSLESLLAEIAKLERLRGLGLPPDLLRSAHREQVKRFRRRAAIETAWELRRHTERIRLPLLAFWCVPRQAEVIDGLVELLIQVTHRITVKAERRALEELVEEAVEVRGKAVILFRIAEAAVGSPEGVVREVIFPAAGQSTLEALAREAQALGTPRSRRVHTAVRASYGSYYRRMMPKLLAALEFRSNNGAHRPLLDALDVIRRAEGEGRQYFRTDEIAIEGVIRPKWRDLVIEDAPGGGQRINRINYEICVLQTLRERLRCKEIWVAGADRFRNPDEDLPAGFADRRAACYGRLGLPMQASDFVEGLRVELADALRALDHGMPRNPDVRLDPRRRHPIIVSPLDPQPEPPGLAAIKAELGRRWPMTGLLDVVKEADLRTDFTKAFATAATREATDRDDVRRRLLLCLYGLGTNAGLKRLTAGGHGYSYKELLHTRRRYIDADALREATRRVVNATLAVRNPGIWGESTTACASDSKHFGAFDQNLMTEWHARYGGRGVMIYWHVERGSVCIHSRLRRCSSSEVAAMIEGVLRHDTEMEIERQYVDSHGQSEVAFAFCRLLGFQLLPRLKAISAQRLYLPEAGSDAHPHLACILTRTIDWALVEQQYDEMARYATAMAEQTADPETILRRFTRANLQHRPTKGWPNWGRRSRLFSCAVISPT